MPHGVRRRARRMFRGVRRVRARELPTLMRAAVTIIVVEVLVRRAPLPRTARLLGVHLDLGPRPPAAEVLPLEALPPTAQRQLRCATKVANVWPFSHGPCLRRALVGGHMVQRLHPVVRLGILGEGRQLGAHAWLEIDDRPLERVDGLAVFASAAS